MPEFVGFQTTRILVPCGISFKAVGVFGPAFHLLFKSGFFLVLLSVAILTNFWPLLPHSCQRCLWTAPFIDPTVTAMEQLRPLIEIALGIEVYLK